MSYHEWGDEWFQKHGETLNKAMHDINLWYHSKTGKFVSMKEKYGTIRYEFIGSIGVVTKEEHKILHRAIEEAALKYPQIKDEILCDSPFDDQSDPYWTKCE